MPKRDLAISAAALLAVAAAIASPSAAQIARREISASEPSKLELGSGRGLRCSVAAWSGEFLEGSCGTYRWEDLKPTSALSLLRSIVPAKDAAAAADAAAIVLSLSGAPALGRSALDWARRQGATPEQLEGARREADVLRRARLERLAKAEEARLSAVNPESGTFPAAKWSALAPADFDAASAESLEAARAMLARAGGSGTLFETPGLSLLAESGDDAFRTDAAMLEGFIETWTARFAEAGVTFTPQGRIPVVVVADVDRWRALVASSFGGDPSVHREVVVIYGQPSAGGAPRATVLVAPQSDRARFAYAAALGVARAMLHYSGSPQRPPAWINEGLPRAMADLSVPGARMDEALRRPALEALRAGGPILPLLAARYGDAIWSADGDRARSTSYLFTRWLCEQGWVKTLKFAKEPVAGESADARFQRIFGVSLASAATSAQRWFATND